MIITTTALSSGAAPITMSRVEIAELTGKRHDHVMRDIRDMLEALETNERRFAPVYTDSKGEQRPCYALPKNLTTTLVSGYSIALRARIVDRWMGLECEVATPAVPVGLPDVTGPVV